MKKTPCQVTIVPKKNSRGGARSRRIGDYFEKKVKAAFIEKGYWAMRTPASQSPLDVLALRDGQAVMVQCKVNYKDMKKDDWDKLIAVANTAGAVPLFAYRSGTEMVLEYHDGSKFTIHTSKEAELLSQLGY